MTGFRLCETVINSLWGGPVGCPYLKENGRRRCPRTRDISGLAGSKKPKERCDGNCKASSEDQGGASRVGVTEFARRTKHEAR